MRACVCVDEGDVCMYEGMCICVCKHECLHVCMSVCVCESVCVFVCAFRYLYQVHADVCVYMWSQKTHSLAWS